MLPKNISSRKYTVGIYKKIAIILLKGVVAK